MLTLLHFPPSNPTENLYLMFGINPFHPISSFHGNRDNQFQCIGLFYHSIYVLLTLYSLDFFFFCFISANTYIQLPSFDYNNLFHQLNIPQFIYSLLYRCVFRSLPVFTIKVNAPLNCLLMHTSKDSLWCLPRSGTDSLSGECIFNNTAVVKMLSKCTLPPSPNKTPIF